MEILRDISILKPTKRLTHNFLTTIGFKAALNDDEGFYLFGELRLFYSYNDGNDFYAFEGTKDELRTWGDFAASYKKRTGTDFSPLQYTKHDEWEWAGDEPLNTLEHDKDIQ